MPKQSRHVDVDHGEAGASPVDHPIALTPLIALTPQGNVDGKVTEAVCKAVAIRTTGCESQRSHHVCRESDALHMRRECEVSIGSHTPDHVGATPTSATERASRVHMPP